jgi:hypothetical protein
VPSPELVAVWAKLGMIPSERVPLWAAHWLVAGYDGEHVVHLAGLHGDDSREVNDALRDALLDCGVTLPESEAAAAAVVYTDLGAHAPRWQGRGALGVPAGRPIAVRLPVQRPDAPSSEQVVRH